MEDPKRGQRWAMPARNSQWSARGSAVPHKDGAPTIEELYSEEFPRVQYVEIKEGMLRMLPDEWLAREDEWDEVERILEDDDNGVIFPANRDTAEADVVVVEWFCITTRIHSKDSRNASEKAAGRSCCDRIKEDEDVTAFNWIWK